MKHRGMMWLAMCVLSAGVGCTQPEIIKVFAGEENVVGGARIGKMGEIAVNARVLHSGTISYYYTSDKNAEGFAHNECGSSAQRRCQRWAPEAVSEASLLEPLSYRAGGIPGTHTLTLYVTDGSSDLVTARVTVEVTDP